MGVAGLWDQLHPYATVESLTALSIDAFETTKSKGFRLGIDASIWFFHAEGGKEGENPQLRTIFFRCASLLRSPLLPLFVFDGPDRPSFKRNKRIDRAPNKLIAGTKAIIEAFGFEAPGEAEAELAMLNADGVIDGILSDDVDTFVFGALKVLRNLSNNLSGNKSNPVLNSDGKDDKNHVRMYEAHKLSLHRDDMVLIALMYGGDYIPAGVVGCGMKTAVALAKCGFGKQLVHAYTTMDAETFKDEFLSRWRRQIINELRTNSMDIVGRKLKSLANAISDEFPDIPTINSYLRPITSKSKGRRQPKISFDGEPSLPAIAYLCEFYFEWGYLEQIIKRFRTVIWSGVVNRILRHAILLDDVDSLAGADDNLGGPGTKMIERHFTKVSQTLSRLQASVPDPSIPAPKKHPPLLVTKIYSSRRHASTDGLVEYRVEIRPNVLVELTKTGVVGIRAPEAGQNYGSDKSDLEDDDSDSSKGAKKVVAPSSPLRLWVPAALLNKAEPALVKAWDQAQQVKAEKAAATAQRKAEKLAKKAGATEMDIRPKKKKASSSDISVVKDSKEPKKIVSPVMPPQPFPMRFSPDEEELFNDKASRVSNKGKARALYEEEEEEEERFTNSPSRHIFPLSPTPSPQRSPVFAEEADEIFTNSPSRHIIPPSSSLSPWKRPTVLPQFEILSDSDSDAPKSRPISKPTKYIVLTDDNLSDDGILATFMSSVRIESPKKSPRKTSEDVSTARMTIRDITHPSRGKSKSLSVPVHPKKPLHVKTDENVLLISSDEDEDTRPKVSVSLSTSTSSLGQLKGSLGVKPVVEDTIRQHPLLLAKQRAAARAAARRQTESRPLDDIIDLT
ncbi:hypothetical protein C8J56DRAFT_885473 [Mycena floridula]|nr:hypothetical protein C8J56DRAFT_885473 [Mycena floridula]